MTIIYNKKDKSIVISVQDNGYGMSQNQLKGIFKPHHTYDKGRSKHDGLGLGLVISKNIIDLHQGNIRAISNEDEGSMFTVSLPLIRNAATKTLETIT